VTRSSAASAKGESEDQADHEQRLHQGQRPEPQRNGVQAGAHGVGEQPDDPQRTSGQPDE